MDANQNSPIRAQEPRSKHPPGVAILVSLKLWELFSYQGMRAFLLFYVMAAFGLGDARGAMIVGSYSAIVLALSVAGGLVADRWLGQKEPTVIGACVIISGHLCLAVETLLGDLGGLGEGWSFNLFCCALALIAVGTGLLKPNVLNLIGGLYRRDDPKRESGYYLYYLGVNVGSFFAPIACGYLANAYGWAWGFGAAAIGMAAGLVILFAGRRFVVRATASGFEPIGAATSRPPRAAIYGMAALAVLASAWLIQHGLTLGILLAVSLLAGGGYLLFVTRQASDWEARGAVLRLFGVMPVPILFVILFEQFALSINLLADRVVDRGLLGHTVAAPQLLSLNSLFVLVFLPLINLAWRRLAARRGELPVTTKFAIGFASMAFGFALLEGALSGDVQPDGRIGIIWIAGAYLFITLGELCIAPLVYSLPGRIVPRHMEGIAMGLLLLTFAIGNLLAGALAIHAAVPVGADLAHVRTIYAGFFLLPLGLAALAVVGSLSLRRIVQ